MIIEIYTSTKILNSGQHELVFSNNDYKKCYTYLALQGRIYFNNKIISSSELFIDTLLGNDKDFDDNPCLSITLAKSETLSIYCIRAK